MTRFSVIAVAMLVLVATPGCLKKNAAKEKSSASTLQDSPKAPLGSPTNLRVALSAAGEMRISWTDNSSEELGFKVERAPHPTLGFLVVGTTAADTTVLYDRQGIVVNTTYYYRVYAYNASGVSLPTETMMVTTPSTFANLAAPSDLTGSAVSTTQINLAWVDNSAAEEGFEVSRSTDGGILWTPLATTAANVTTYQNRNLTPGSSYRYRVRAVLGTSYSSYSNEVGLSTPSTETISPPMGLTTSVKSSTSVVLNWSDTSGNEDGFKVEKSTDGVNFGQVLVTPANSQTAEVTGLTAGTLYAFRVRAFNTTGDSPFSNIVTARTLKIAPLAPTVLTGTGQADGGIRLTWTDNSDNEESFVLERRVGPTFGAFAVLTTLNPDATSYTDNDIVAISAYEYRLKAANSVGESGYTNIVNIGAPAVAPAAPSQLVATVLSQTQVKLDWKDNSINESGFKVEQSTNGGTTFTQSGSPTAANVTTFTVAGLTANTP